MTEPSDVPVAPVVADTASGDRMTWTNIYLSFALRRADRQQLDAYLRTVDSSLSIRLRETLAATLAEAGVELPKGEPSAHDHHH